jgi:hypothetical protein
VIAGNTVASRNLFNGMYSVRFQGEQHQQSQGIVCMARKTHGRGTSVLTGILYTSFRGLSCLAVYFHER